MISRPSVTRSTLVSVPSIAEFQALVNRVDTLQMRVEELTEQLGTSTVQQVRDRLTREVRLWRDRAGFL